MTTMFYIFIDDEQRGPYSIEQLAELGITPETEVWAEGMADWQSAGDVPELTTLLQRLEFERHSAATPPRRVTPPPPPATAPAQPPGAQPPATARRGGSGLKWLIALLIVAILLAVLVMTCPGREQHRQAIMGATRSWVSDKVESTGVGDILGELVRWVSGKGADIALDELLMVENHFIYSTGKLAIGAEPKTVSVGVLGHVFTFGGDDIDRALRQAVGLDERQPSRSSVGITPEPEIVPAPDDTPTQPDDTLGSVMPREGDEITDPAGELLDSLASAAKRQAIRVAKEWAKKQIDNL